MGGKKNLGIVLLIVGIIALIVSLAANAIGIGNPSAFGWLQIVGAVAGVILAVIGLFLTLQK